MAISYNDGLIKHDSVLWTSSNNPSWTPYYDIDSSKSQPSDFIFLEDDSYLILKAEIDNNKRTNGIIFRMAAGGSQYLEYEINFNEFHYYISNNAIPFETINSNDDEHIYVLPPSQEEGYTEDEYKKESNWKQINTDAAASASINVGQTRDLKYLGNKYFDNEVYIYIWRSNKYQRTLAVDTAISPGTSGYGLFTRILDKEAPGSTVIDASYTVTYNANGRGTAPNNQTKNAGINLTLRPFIDDQIEGGNTVTVTITGNANGSIWSGSNGSATYTTAKYKYIQQSWNTKANGTGTSYSSQDTYSNDADITLFAIWPNNGTKIADAIGTGYTLPGGTPTKTDITVTFNANGGSTTKTSETSSWSFNGWYTSSSGGSKRTSDSKVTAAETVYAQGKYNSVSCPSTAQCTRPGYKLLGWSSSQTATTATYNPGASYTPTTDIELYAVWEADGLAHIYTPEGWKTVQVYVYHINTGSNDSISTGWHQVIPYVFKDGSWHLTQ